MHRNCVSHRQLILWFATALLSPMLLYAGKLDLWSLTVLGALAVVLVLTVYRYGVVCDSRFFRWIQALWLVVLLGVLTGQANMLWPEAKAFPAVPLVLLTVAALSALREVDGTAQVNTILFWIVAFLLLCVIAAGLSVVNVQHIMLRPTSLEIRHWWLFLIPALAMFFPKVRKSKVGAFIPFMLIPLSIWSEAILSNELCAEAAWPFYEASKSVRISAVADRLEPLVSIGATIGYYSIYSLLLTIITSLIGNDRSGKRKIVVLGLSASAALLIGRWLVIPGILVSGISLLLWIVVSIIAGIIGKQKNTKNNT